MLKNIQLFTLLALMLSGNTLDCAQANAHTNDYPVENDLIVQRLLAATTPAFHGTQPNDSNASAAPITVVFAPIIIEGKKHYNCPHPGCERTHKSKAHIEKHYRIHSGEKPFQCDHCDKSFTQAIHLKTHMRIHTGEKPFKCNQCDQSFAASSNLIAHKHIHTGERPYKCDQCDKSYNDPSNLRQHKQTHISEKNFQCDQCNSAFIRKVHLTLHKKTHSGEKPFKCGQCNKSFTQSSHLARHKLNHTGIKPFKCDQCNIAYAREDRLTLHNATKKHKTNALIAHAALASAQDFLASQSSSLSQQLPNSLGNELINAHQDMISSAQHMSAEDIFSTHIGSPTQFASNFNIMSPTPTSAASILPTSTNTDQLNAEQFIATHATLIDQEFTMPSPGFDAFSPGFFNHLQSPQN